MGSKRTVSRLEIEIPLAVGGGSVPVVLPGVANVAGNPPGAQQGPPPPDKDLESPSSTRLEALVPSRDSRARTRSPSPWPGRASPSASQLLAFSPGKEQAAGARTPQLEETPEKPPSSRAEGLVPWTVRRSNQSILKEISPEYSLEGLMLKLKLQYFGHLIRRDRKSVV